METPVPSQPQALRLELMLGDRRLAACRVLPEAVVQASRRLYDEFRASSAACGMAMTDEEIRATCWAPLAARLSADVADSQAAAFAELALCFLVDAAFPLPGAGESYTVTIAADGKVTVERRPHRLLARDRIVLGNHRKAMVPFASGAAGTR